MTPFDVDGATGRGPGVSIETKPHERPLTLIVAMTPSGVIGRDGKIPWHIPEDMRRFKTLTTGHAIIMGSKTYESIGRPLPNRRNMVVSRQVAFNSERGTPDEVEWYTTPESALEHAYNTDAHPFVIGGAKIYRALLKYVTHLEITYVVRPDTYGNVHFPWLSSHNNHYPEQWVWRCSAVEHAKESLDVEFHTFVKRSYWLASYESKNMQDVK